MRIDNTNILVEIIENDQPVDQASNFNYLGNDIGCDKDYQP